MKRVTLVSFSTFFFLLSLFQARGGDFITGLQAFKAQDYATAYEQFLPLAQSGDIRAQTYVGMMYFNGLSVSRNLENAADWYGRAAENGHPHAQFHLGWMYDTGKGLEKDKKLAADWLAAAARQGHPRAQNNLGVMYYKGEGVGQDSLLAQMWYMIAASKGMPEAKENVRIMTKNLSPKETAKVKQMVRTCMSSNYRNCD